MERALMVALVQPLIETAVNYVQSKFAGNSGPNKRMVAWKYVRDRLQIYESLLGSLGVKIDDSMIFGMIDGTVTHSNDAGQFEKHTKTRHYNLKRPDPAFKVTNPDTGAETWVTINDAGELEPARLVVDRATGQLIPEVNLPAPELQPVLAGGGAGPHIRLNEPAAPWNPANAPAPARKKRATRKK